MSDMLSAVRTMVRAKAEGLGRSLNSWSQGRITPDMVTLFGLAMHVPTALLIATGHFLWAAGFLVVFGLFDTLDGGLARAQGKSSNRGMLLDASTDRFKEVMLYTGAAYWLVGSTQPRMAVWAAMAAGASVSVSYVKAKGEAAVASSGGSGKDGKRIPHAILNRMFADGLLTFELRMAALVVGLLFDQLAWVVAIIAVLASFTAVQRLFKIYRQL